MRTKAVWGTPCRLTCAVLLLAQGACLTAPRSVEAPAPFLQANAPKRIWVTLTNGDAMVIDAPRVYGDSLLGSTRRGGGHEDVWLPLSRLQDVKTRRVSGGRTALLGGAIAVVVGLALGLIPTGGGTNDRPCMNEGEPCQ
jgi:hypothetical protein